MKKTSTLLFSFFFLSISSIQVFAQEQLTDLRINSLLQSGEKIQIDYSRTGPLSLPFVDDFSYRSKYPNPNLWMDAAVYVNTTNYDTAECGSSQLFPPTIGVATLDGLNRYGFPYDTNYVGSTHGLADTLTSQQIDLSTQTSVSGVYLSFYYQNAGLGNTPETNDTLLLEFFNGTTWNHIWSHAPSMNSQPAQRFKQVMIAIIDASYFIANFQFRFKNYATLTGFNDLWNLDYVKLNSGRTAADTILNDVAFIKIPTSVLKNYQAIPFNQFINNQSTELSNTVDLLLQNNFTSVRNTNINYQARDTFNHITLLAHQNSSFNFNPSSCSNTPFINFTSFPGSFLDSAAIVTTEFIASQVGDGNQTNDTTVKINLLKNYFAYDDGSAEKAYGLVGAGAKFAYQFNLNVADTFQAVQIHFSHFNTDIHQKFFSVMVWSSLAPETVIYQKDFIHPDYIDSTNGFAVYGLDNQIIIPAGTVYIGFLQTYSDMLNMGFDLNNDEQSNIFYNTGSGWQNTQFHGAVMFRPVFGHRLSFAETKNISDANSITVFPNPVATELHLNFSEAGKYQIKIFDQLGKEILSANSSIQHPSFNIERLSSGIYFVKVISEQKTFTSKFIKQ